MKNKTKKFTVIIAAIFIAALCVFSITFRNGGGVSAHAAASAGVQEQATQVSEPVARAETATEQQLIFNAENQITKSGDKLKAKSWVNGKDYDSFVYSWTIEGISYADYSYVFMNTAESVGIAIGNQLETELTAYIDFLREHEEVDAHIKIAKASSSHYRLHIDLTDESLKMYHTIMSGTPTIGGVEFMKEAVAYNKFKSVVFSNELSLLRFTFENNTMSTGHLTENIRLYKTVEVPPPIEYEQEYLLEESNVLHDGEINNIGKGKAWLGSVKEYDSYNYRITCEVDGNTATKYTFQDGSTMFEIGMSKAEFSYRMATACYYPINNTSDRTSVTLIISAEVRLIALEINYAKDNGSVVKLISKRASGTVEDERTVVDGYTYFSDILINSDEFTFKTAYVDSFEGKVIEEMTIFKNQELGTAVQLPPNPTKEGHTFVGWYYDEEFTRPYKNRPIYADTELYAKFEINKYTVSFNPDNGEEPTTQTVEWNTVLTPETPTKRGYEFLGWFYEDGTEYTGQEIKEDTTLIAHWQIKIFTVTFYVDGEVYIVKEVEYGTRFVEIIEEAATENLELLTVLEGETEKKINKYLNVEITDNYDITAVKIKADPTSAQIFFGKYPWIFAASGAGLALTVALIGVAGYFAQKQSVQSTGRKKR